MAYNYGLFPIKTQKVTSSGSSAATSDGMLAHTQFVRLVATANCHVAFGESPTATTSDMYLPADDIEIIKIRPGEKVAVLHGSSVNLFVTELSG